LMMKANKYKEQLWRVWSNKRKWLWKLKTTPTILKAMSINTKTLKNKKPYMKICKICKKEENE
jgi:hypothetical protein